MRKLFLKNKNLEENECKKIENSLLDFIPSTSVINFLNDGNYKTDVFIAKTKRRKNMENGPSKIVIKNTFANGVNNSNVSWFSIIFMHGQMWTNIKVLNVARERTGVVLCYKNLGKFNVFH